MVSWKAQLEIGQSSLSAQWVNHPSEDRFVKTIILKSQMSREDYISKYYISVVQLILISLI
jgi:hypothetical protein